MAFVESVFAEAPQYSVYLRYDEANGGIQRYRWENRGGGTLTITINAPVLANPLVKVAAPGESGFDTVPGNIRVGLTKGAVDEGEVTIDVAWVPIR